MLGLIDIYKKGYSSFIQRTISRENSLSDKKIIFPGSNAVGGIGASDRASLVLPGSSVLYFLEEISRADYIIGVNLSASLPLPFDSIVIERLGISHFGDVQCNCIFSHHEMNSTSVILKNLWMPNRFDFSLLDGMDIDLSLLMEVPLRASFAIRKKALIKYLMHTKIAFSSWMSSLFVCLSFLADSGFKHVDIYGMDFGGKYCWEDTDDLVVDSHSIRSIVSRTKHTTEMAKHKPSDIYNDIVNCFLAQGVFVQRKIK